MLLTDFFDSIFTSGMNFGSFALCIGVALATGFVLSFLCYFHTTSSKNFFISTSLLPAAIAMVISLVNGNIGAGVAVAGAFSLVRFRSAPGTAKEICVIFISVATGLALGLGYLAYGVIFAIFAGLVLLLLSNVNIFQPKTKFKEKLLKITIPEDINYTNVFDDIFTKYTSSYELIQVKTTNMGSMFKLTYKIKLNDDKLEKQFIDELRCRNGNLEIMTMFDSNDNNEL